MEGKKRGKTATSILEKKKDKKKIDISDSEMEVEVKPVISKKKNEKKEEKPKEVPIPELIQEKESEVPEIKKGKRGRKKASEVAEIKAKKEAEAKLVETEDDTETEEKEEVKKDNVVKKRGRKPKKKDFEYVEVKPVNFCETDETLILHIPINLKKFEGNEEYEASEEVNVTVPQPFNQSSDYCYIGQENNTKTFSEKYQNNSTEFLLQQFKDAKKHDSFPVATNIYCWWCCHPFKNTPVGIPIRYVSKKFEVLGCFCSFSCASAYNIQHGAALTSERNSLLHLMCRQLCDLAYCDIKPSPPKEILQIFGGFMTIDEYRQNCISNEYYFKIINPPMISIIPQVEITAASKLNNGYSFMPINEKRLKMAHENQKIKMNNYINSKNTIESYMKIVKNN